MPAYVFNRDIKVDSADGMYCASFTANVPLEVIGFLVPAVVAAGGVLSEDLQKGKAVLPELQHPANTEESIAQVAVAMKAIIDKGDAASLTSTGMPRANVLEQQLGRATTREERDQAYAQLEV